MRCARCDRIAVPQSVGRTTDGRVVFGWCLDCMEQAGCVQVEVAGKPRPGPRVVGRRRVGRKRPPRADGADPRRRIAVRIALTLGLWALVLVVTGACLLGRRDPKQASALGNGTPALLLAGGTATGLVGLFLGIAVSGRSSLGSRTALRVLGWLSLATAAALLLVAIVRHDPRRSLPIVAAAGIALALAFAARRWQVRRPSRVPDSPQ